MFEVESFAYKCLKCQRLCPVKEGLRCFNCKSYSNSGTEMNERFYSEQPEKTIPRETDVVSPSRKDLDPNIVALDGMGLVQNGIFEASGSSGSQRDKNNPYMIGKMLQSSNKGEIKSRKCEEIIKASICKYCKDGILEPECEESVIKNIDSLYYNPERTNFLIHRTTHIPKTICNICGKEHAQENSHNSKHECPIYECRMTFQCRTRFYEHFQEHTEYFYKICWVCCRKFKEHITEKYSNTYICCVCGFKSNNITYFKDHNELHLPRSFCNLCKKEYLVQDKNFHCREVKCFVCENTLKCEMQLKEHFENHVKDFSENCRTSTSKKTLYCSPFVDYFETSSEVKFKNHLYSHVGLLFVYCETCRKRFSMTRSFHIHVRACKALPYKCEICETRFHTIGLLHAHGLMKHTG